MSGAGSSSARLQGSSKKTSTLDVETATLPSTAPVRVVHRMNSPNADHHGLWATCGCLFAVGILLTVILVPVSLSNVEYYEYGLLKQRSTGKVFLDKVYEAGRYSVGPDRTFKKFRADAHYLTFEDLSVFTGGKLETLLDIRIIYFLRKENIIELHNVFDRNYDPVVQGRIIGAIKNTSPSFATTDFFEKRLTIEKTLLEAVRKATKSVFVDVSMLLLLRVGIPDKIKDRQLNIATQLEDNEREKFMQRSQLIRKNTSFLVNEIENKANIITERAKSEAKLLTEKARADSAFLVEEARFKGLSSIFEALNITTPEEKTTLDFLKAIEGNDKAGMYFNFKSLFVGSSLPSHANPEQTNQP